MILKGTMVAGPGTNNVGKEIRRPGQDLPPREMERLLDPKGMKLHELLEEKERLLAEAKNPRNAERVKERLEDVSRAAEVRIEGLVGTGGLGC